MQCKSLESQHIDPVYFKMDFGLGLGVARNSHVSTGVRVSSNGFYLFDNANEYKHLDAPQLYEQYEAGVKFPETGQEWLVELDFVTRVLSIFLRLQKQWTLGAKIAIPTEEAVVPAVTLEAIGDEIELM